MARNEPSISFLFPYRWLKEDREFLFPNLVAQVEKQIGKDGVDELKRVMSYNILVSYFYKEPVVIPLTKTDVNKAFKKLFPNGKCIDVSVKYTQHESKTLLPLCDLQIYL